MDRGEPSEGPSGRGQVGFEHEGYAPGYGEYPSGSVDYGPTGGYAGPGGGASPRTGQTPWGKILGISCGVLLLLLLFLAGCGALLLVMADPGVPGAEGGRGSGETGFGLTVPETGAGPASP